MTTAIESILHYVDKKEVVELTRSLIRIQSVYRPKVDDGNEEKVARFIAHYLKNMGLEVGFSMKK
ncbi:hypothetical protein AS030_17690 [Fictibacillus enclensis]|uniref:Peptidase M20 dimerisation domain-containing protein n=1 Tax=Fictibacillus enclensis TaxID=1017270 RepID=A0A0V8J589_9BACL|nr:hypothetical protein AS030_17690 [Fictibacillus enclensis]